jgi:branched-chain amino acid transport system permease protein
MRTRTIIVIAVLLAVAALFPLYTGPYMQSVATTVLIYMALSVSWDMLLRSGQLSLGIAGFFGLGAYSGALIFLYTGMPRVLAIAFGGVMSFTVAFLVGLAVLRLRGLYFAITTLALAEIFRVIVRNWSSLTGGAQGEVLPTAIFEGNSAAIYLLILVVAVLTIGASEVFRRSKWHFALTSIRNNETVARTSGVNIYKYLVFAFAISAGIQGVVGAVYSHSFGFVTPGNSFSVDFTLLPIAMGLLGGIYGTAGPIVGALLLGFAGEYLKLYIPYGHQIVYGIIIVLVIVFMPRGIVGLIKSRMQARAEHRAEQNSQGTAKGAAS